MLQSITIGNENFMYASTFIIDNLINLQNIVIGQESFMGSTSSSRSFSILNCIELESIEIGCYSFSFRYYSSGFELKNLPKLSTIKIGEIGSDSRNFYHSSFEIKGRIDMILLMNRSSTFEFDYNRR